MTSLGQQNPAPTSRPAWATPRALAAVAAAWLALSSVPGLSADPPCRVLDPELQASYSGGCANGLADGRGTAAGTARYEGEFKAGKKHGRGAKTWANGDRYEGEFLDDRKHGRGAYVFGRGPWAGQRYEGEYRADRRHGQGVYEWPFGDRYEGGWANDAMTGPPTPMMLMRARATEAARAALGKPGLRVCQWVEAGIGLRERVSGVVVRFTDSLLAVRLDSVGASGIAAGGVPARAGEIVWDDWLAWEPC